MIQIFFTTAYNHVSGYYTNTWVPIYLATLKSPPFDKAFGLSSGLMLFGGLLGPLWGLLADRIGPKKILLSSGIISALMATVHFGAVSGTSDFYVILISVLWVFPLTAYW